MQDARASLAPRLAMEMRSWKSIEMHVSEDRVFNAAFLSDNVIPCEILEETYIEDSQGNRFYDSFSSTRSRPDLKMRETFFCDGRQSVRLVFDIVNYKIDKPIEVVIERNFGREGSSCGTSRPMPYQIFFLNKIPLDEALSKATHLRGDRALGRPCEVFLFSNVPCHNSTREQVYYLDNETGIPLVHLEYNSRSDYLAGREAMRWEARSLDTIQGHHFPLKSHDVVYQVDPHTGRLALWLTADITVKSLSYNNRYNRERFWPGPEQGLVGDEMIPHQDLHPGEARVIHPGQPTVAISADPPTDWTPTLSGFGMGVGLLMLAAALIARWWRR